MEAILLKSCVTKPRLSCYLSFWEIKSEVTGKFLKQATVNWHGNKLPSSLICPVFWDRTLLCSPCWPKTFDAPALASQALGLQMCTTMPWLLTKSNLMLTNHFFYCPVSLSFPYKISNFDMTNLLSFLSFCFFFQSFSIKPTPFVQLNGTFILLLWDEVFNSRIAK
jgi:hypothetical protein